MLKAKQTADRLFVCLSGEIDHHSAKTLREEIEEKIKETNPKRLHLDFKNVSFMDSSGVGMIIGRYRTMTEKGGFVTAGGLSPTVEKLFRLAGLHRIIEITEEDA